MDGMQSSWCDPCKRPRLSAFPRSSSVPASMLHPSIADKVWLALARGDLDEAVFVAFKAGEEAVRAAGSFWRTDYGVDVMRKAFQPGGPLSNPTQSRSREVRGEIAHSETRR